MVKTYYKYNSESVFGLIASAGGNAIFDSSGQLAIVPALENVLIWNYKQGVQIACWNTGMSGEVTCITRSPNEKHCAVGFSDGAIKIYEIQNGTLVITFNGHQRAISSMVYDSTGSRLASGSKDTDIILWDVVGESGISRLRGHKDMITSLRFLNKSNQLVSSSKDTLVKVWDLATNHSIQTVVGHRTEVWSLDINPDETLMLTGTSDDDGLRLWNLKSDAELPVSLLGILPRESRDRLIDLRFHPSLRLIFCHNTDKTLEVYRLRSEEEVLKKKAKRERKRKDKSDPVMIEASNAEIKAADYVKLVGVLRSSSKIRSFDIYKTAVLLALTNNSFEIYQFSETINPQDRSTALDFNCTHHIEMQGHRAEIRALCLSADDELLLSASPESLKLWNMRSKSCIRTMESAYPLCTVFLPGDRHAVVGTKSGLLELHDLSSGALLESIQAHEGAIFSMILQPDRRGLITGSADKDIKFFDFEILLDTETNSRRVSLTHSRTLKMSDQVLALCASPDGRLLAASLLDSTVKLFFRDTLKFFLSLYGHKLPVTCLDISADSQLMVTGSADKNIKLWGLDFGDCHKSIFAHSDSITAVKFVAKTHYCFTASKDGNVRYWDCDAHEQIMSLDKQHHGEIWGLAVSRFGNFLVSGSQDKSLRVFARTEDQVFLEEEKELAMEKQVEESLLKQQTEGDNEENVQEGVHGVTKKTSESLKAGERLLEALTLAAEEQSKLDSKPAGSEDNQSSSALHPLFVASNCDSPTQYVLKVVKQIPYSELEQALLLLSLEDVKWMLQHLRQWTKCAWELETCSRVLFFLLKIHQAQIVNTRMLYPELLAIRQQLSFALKRHKDVMGYNKAALGFLQREMEAKRNETFFDLSVLDEVKNKKKRKNNAAIKVSVKKTFVSQ